MEHLLRQGIGAYLDVNRARLRTFAAFHQPRCAIAARAPQPTALPAGVRIIDPAIHALGEKAERVRDAHHHHLSVLESDETVIEVCGRDRNVFTKAHRVVVIYPGVVARLSAGVFQPLKAWAGILVIGKSFGTVVARRIRPIERVLAFTAIETDECAVRT